ncbi:LOW QUALITY PROTEIN: sodium-dependent glucose transporter 1C-like [Acomys russatus]|uniref:LOW QUALITY PROTEIN: sodium-dependent glucose transporter 1C-like n=1 Tax=Acomys russatus TaxID=60746 RepID=UPI0021E2A41C|nr:LOW QUALITY PROTEIN: sodium-dependent glucose transporter 1C-like [Acomys russatus]
MTESRGSGATAVGQRLLQAETPEKNGLQAVSSGQVGRALRWFTTVVLNAAFLGMGVSAAVLGPTFPDLARNVNRNISSLSEIFVGRALGSLCGAVVGGVLFDCMNHFLLLGLSNVLTAVGLYLTPFCKTAVLLTAMMSVTGVSFGILDTGGNVLILDLWGDKGAPHMQALHFSFALGAFLAPLLAKLAWGTAASAQNHTESDFDPPMLNRSSEAATGSLFAVPDDMNLLWTYASIGTYVLVVSVFLFGLFCKKRSKQEKSTASAQGARRAKYHRALLCLLFLFFFFYVGAEVTYGSYVFSFATSHVGMEESEAAGLNSVFWGTFAACRGLAIFFATLLQPGTMIVLSNIGSLTSSLFLVLFDKSRLCLWIATSVYGASMAATFPSGISWVEQYTSISGKAAAFFVIGASLGEMAIPAVIGILQGHYPDLPVVLYTGLGSAIFTAVLFPVMYKLATLPLERQRRGRRKSEDQRALLSSAELNDCEEENEEEDAEKWNEMDFEVVEMSDPALESAGETPGDVMGHTAKGPHQLPSNVLLGFESSAGSSNSLVNHQDKRD